MRRCPGGRHVPVGHSKDQAWCCYTLGACRLHSLIGQCGALTTAHAAHATMSMSCRSLVVLLTYTGSESTHTCLGGPMGHPGHAPHPTLSPRCP